MVNVHLLLSKSQNFHPQQVEKLDEHSIRMQQKV